MRKSELATVLTGLRAHTLNSQTKVYHDLADKLEKDEGRPFPRIAVAYKGGEAPTVVVAGQPVALMMLDLDAIAATPKNEVTMQGLNASLSWKVASADNKAMATLHDGVVRTYKGLGLAI